MQLSELGPHTLDCPLQPTGDLDAKVKIKDEAELSSATVVPIDPEFAHPLFKTALTDSKLL